MNKPLKSLPRFFLRLIAAVVALAVVIAISIYFAMRASLPVLNGDMSLAGLGAPVTLSRDALGVAVIAAKNMRDANRALGFVHAQERFFEMDLTRRSAAGELSQLFGSATLKVDQEKRRHRLRARMLAHWQALSAGEQQTLAEYTDGINAGLNALAVRPWQYLLLRTTPQAWTAIDSMLVVCEMNAMLQGRSGEARFNDALLRRQIGDTLFDWLHPLGGTFDAPLDGSVVAARPLPSAAQLNVREKSVVMTARAESAPDLELHPGSNNWAVGGARTAHGGAILANDMHLSLGAPNIWFRTQLLVGDGEKRRMVGVSLPGLPGLVVGSNGHIAWGFTNATGKWFDWVPLAADVNIREIEEIIIVKGGEPHTLLVRETDAGPVLRHATIDGKKQAFAFNWALYRIGAVNTVLSQLMTTDSVDAALQLAPRAGMPHQNIVVVDAAGNIGWTIAGRMPHYPDWAFNATRGRFTPLEKLPDRWLAADEYPQIKNPASAHISTANNRLLGGADGKKIGDGGFDPGARGSQIRARLNEKQRFTESDLFAIQRDNESRFLQRWATLIKQTAAQSSDPAHRAAVEILTSWNGKADIDHAGHRLTRAYRQAVVDALWKTWLNAAGAKPIAETTSGGMPSWDGRAEYAVWAAITLQPTHLLPMPHASWQAFLLAQLTSVSLELTKQHGSLAKATWGERNRANIRHPFTRAMPQLGRWLNMPSDPLPGDNNMPLVAGPAFGASERMVVAPGREEHAIFHMPGGQSGHPLSPFYAAGHGDWVSGKTTPLLAGKAVYSLVLKP